MATKNPPICIICGKILDGFKVLKNVAGWWICAEHRVYVKPAKYWSRCTRCGKTHEAGTVLCFYKTANSWKIFEPAGQCGKEQETAPSRSRSSADYTKSNSYWDLPQVNNPYLVLGVSKRSTKAEIKAAYRKLARENHPDRGGDEATMKRINVAYEKLR